MIATLLQDRILLGDGRSVVDPDKVVDYLIKGLQPSDILVTESNEDVNNFNLRATETILTYDETLQLQPFSYDWKIPQSYLDIDLTQYFQSKISSIDNEIVEIRVANELAEVNRRGFQNGLKTIIYIVDIFKQQNIVWGVGRGSSCASYLLFLIGLHCVDCIKYNVPFTEFFHD